MGVRAPRVRLSVVPIVVALSSLGMGASVVDAGMAAMVALAAVAIVALVALPRIGDGEQHGESNAKRKW